MPDLKDPALTPARRPGWLMGEEYIQQPRPTPHWSDRLISELGLPPKVTATMAESYRTFGQVDGATDAQLAELKGVGPVMIKRIRNALEAWKWAPA